MGKMMSIKLTLLKLILAIQHIVLGMFSWSPSRGNSGDMNPENILLMRTCALGDFIFAVPALVELRNRYPKAKIVLVTAASANASLVTLAQTYSGTNSLPWLSLMIPSVIDEAICINFASFKGLWIDARRRVVELNPYVAIILANPGDPGLGLLKKIILLRLLGVRTRIYGWRSRASNRWFRQLQYEAGLFDHHVISPLRSIAELPGMFKVEEIKVNFPLYIDSGSQTWVEALWRASGLSDRRIIAVAPGSIQPHKRWPLEKFISLCQKLAFDFDVYFIVVGTPNDKDLGRRFADKFNGRVINLAGDTSISQSAAILERCELLIGNDGGAMHLGSAMRCPTVSIVSGIEYPNSIEPWFSQELAVRHTVSCAPCYSFTHCPLKHNKCIKDLSVHDVYIKCAKVLS
jgi:ADP-heptose:LPS heptosyltransferase